MAIIRYCDFCGDDLNKYAGKPFEGADKNQIVGISTSVTNSEICKRCLNRVVETLNGIQRENEGKLKGLRVFNLQKYDID